MFWDGIWEEMEKGIQPALPQEGLEGGRKEGGMAVPVLAAQGGEGEGWVSFPT